MIPFTTCVRPRPSPAPHSASSVRGLVTVPPPRRTVSGSEEWVRGEGTGMGDGAGHQRRVRPSIHVDADIHDWGGETPLRVESLDEQSSLTLSTRIGRRRSSSSIRFADDTDTGTDILMITEDDLADILTDPVYPTLCLPTSRSQPLPDAAYAAIPAPIAQHRRMVSGRRSLISSSVHRHLQNGVYGMSVGAAGSDVVTARSGRMLVTLRRRKSMFANVDMDVDPVLLLDGSYNQVVDRFLISCSSWKFSSFTLNTLTGGHSLSHLLLHLFKSYDLIRIFRLDLLCLWKCFRLFEQGYHETNPYHNGVHAADVTQAMHCFIQEEKIGPFLTPIEKMCAILAAVAHDLDHPGVNQHFLIATNSHLAALYNNLSVLESHHWRFAISCIRESGLFDHFSEEQWKQVRHLLKSLILATDITQQPKYLARLKRCLSSPASAAASLRMSDPENRLFILKIALKCADLGNPCRSWELSRRWSELICSEFYRQGDFERQLNLPITPICNRYEASMAKIQTDFFQNVVTPLFKLWDQFLSSDLSRQLIANLNFNYNQWQSFLTKKLIDRRHSMISESSSSFRAAAPRRRSKSVDETAVADAVELDRLRDEFRLTAHLQPLSIRDSGRQICDGVHGCGTPSSPDSSLSDPDDDDDIPGSHPLEAEHGISSPDPKVLDEGSFVQLHPHPFAPQYWGRRGSAPGCIGIYASAELAAAALVFLQGALNPPRRSSAPVEAGSDSKN